MRVVRDLQRLRVVVRRGQRRKADAAAEESVSLAMLRIIVTTKLGLPVQPFTVAHELRHLMLGHGTSLDETIDFAGRNAPASRPNQEAAADTFTSELPAPRSLLLASAQRHGWTKDKRHQPKNIYPLSLRLGISYQAARWALATCEVLTRPEADRLRTRTVKELKRALAPAAFVAHS